MDHLVNECTERKIFCISIAPFMQDCQTEYPRILGKGSGFIYVFICTNP